MAYLSTDDKIDFKPEQLDNLRRYIALGGLLVINPEERRSRQWSEDLCKQLFPGYKLTPLESSHFIYGGLNGWEIKRAGVSTVRNGVRELVVVFNDDMGYRYQSDDKPGLRSPHWRVLFNLFCLMTDRGQPHLRLKAPYAQLKPAKPDVVVPVGLCRYEGDWQPEPGCYALANHTLAERFGLGIQPSIVDLNELDANTPVRLMHLMGVKPIELTTEQLDRIKRFIDAGGTVLVETVGGWGTFAFKLREQIEEHLGRGAERNRRSPIITGHNGKGARVGRAVYRQFSTELTGGETRPRLHSIEINDRPAVVFSDEDISLGLMHCSYFLIDEYASKTATDLFANILLSASVG